MTRDETRALLKLLGTFYEPLPTTDTLHVWAAALEPFTHVQVFSAWVWLIRNDQRESLGHSIETAEVVALAETVELVEMLPGHAANIRKMIRDGWL